MATTDERVTMSRLSGRLAVIRHLPTAVLLAAFPALHVALFNPGQVSIHGLAFVLAGTTTGVVMAVTLLRVARYDWSATLVAMAGLLLLTFAYGPIHGWLEVRATSVGANAAIKLPVPPRLLYEYMLLLWVVCIGVWLLIVGRLGSTRTANIAKAMPVVVGILYVSMFAQVGVRALRQADDHRFELTHNRDAVSAPSVVGYNPDIYYIVLDGYARADVLQRLYGDDNSEFLGALRSRGFAVASRSSVNYYWTFLSLASSLNYQYLDSLIGDPIEAQRRGRGPFYEAIRDNEAARFLRERGYRYLHFQSTWGGTIRNEFADEQIGCEGTVFQDDFTRAVIELTPLKMLGARVAVDLADCYRNHFSTLSELGSVPGPKFVFAHFLPPHHPYLFDRHGRTLRSATISDQFEFQKRLWERRDLYLDQLKYVNERVLGAVDAILAASGRPPVILIQSDHGPNLNDGLPPDERKAVRLANLSVAFLPGAPLGLLADDGTAVNKLPRIFNYYFGADIPIQPDRHFYSAYDSPFELDPVALDGTALESRQALLDPAP